MMPDVENAENQTDQTDRTDRAAVTELLSRQYGLEPIHAEDVADAVLAVLQLAAETRRGSPIPWPETARPGVPLNRRRNGWHWVATRPGVEPIPRLWLAKWQRWQEVSASDIHFAQWVYWGVCELPRAAL